LHTTKSCPHQRHDEDNPLVDFLWDIQGGHVVPVGVPQGRDMGCPQRSAVDAREVSRRAPDCQIICKTLGLLSGFACEMGDGISASTCISSSAKARSRRHPSAFPPWRGAPHAQSLPEFVGERQAR
jgi:hypothetical protein